MSSVTCHISISLDGFVAGPKQSVDTRVGEGRMRVHHWAFATEAGQREHGREAGERNADDEVVRAVVVAVGA